MNDLTPRGRLEVEQAADDWKTAAKKAQHPEQPPRI